MSSGKIPRLFLVAFVLCGSAAVHARLGAAPTEGSRSTAGDVPRGLDPRALVQAESTGSATVLVHLAEQADLAGADSLSTKEARALYGYRHLREVADRTQPSLVRWLESRGVVAKRFWIENLVVVEADAPTLKLLASRPEVASVMLEGTMELIEPLPSAGKITAPSPDVIERGLREIGVDDVWRMGYKGAGIVVAASDTGAASAHPALIHAYRGEETGHDYNWFDAVHAADEPVDLNSHGTHVLGTMVGKAGSRDIGAAPAAKWIACRLIEQDIGSDQQILKCLQWLAAPTKVDGVTDPRPEMAPDVINASWGELPGASCLSRALDRSIANLHDMGVLFVASAGNRGNGCNTVCVPGAFESALTVANYDVGNRRINDSSSRGPVDWPDGAIVKPDIAAPGTEINSSIPPNRYEQKTGTSMSAPHIAGVAALILSARPDLRGRPDLIKDFVIASGRAVNADRCGPGGDRAYNNLAGHGLVMADDAVTSALTATPPPPPTVTPTRTATSPASPTPTATATQPAPTSFTIQLPRLLGRRLR